MLSGAAVVEYLAGLGAAPFREFLARQRWFAAKGRAIQALEIEDWALLREEPPLLLLLLAVDRDRYYVPLSSRAATDAVAGQPEREVARLGDYALFDAHWDPDFGRRLLGAIATGRDLPGHAGSFGFRPISPWAGPDEAEIQAIPARPLGAEQSNTSIRLGDWLILKSFRRPQAGINPDFEVTHFLTARTGFSHVARLHGWIEYRGPGAGEATIAMLQPFVPNSGDGWSHALGHLRRLAPTLVAQGLPPADDRAARAGIRAGAEEFIQQMRQLGAITGELHSALASDGTLAPFRPEAVTAADVDRWSRGIAQDAARVLAELERRAPALPDAARIAAAPILDAAQRLGTATTDLGLLADGNTHKARCHGDYHLGQVLRTATGFVVLDFEGEPARPVDERRQKHSPLRDVAGMLRSFNYAVSAALAEAPATDRPSLESWLGAWEALVVDAYREGYRQALERSPVRLAPTGEENFGRVCAVFELEKAIYELGYELSHRPEWLPIPAAGIRRILGLGRRDG